MAGCPARSAASGGSTAFGAKTGDVLTWATSAIIFGIFIILAVCLDLVVSIPNTNRTVANAKRATADYQHADCSCQYGSANHVANRRCRCIQQRSFRWVRWVPSC